MAFVGQTLEETGSPVDEHAEIRVITDRAGEYFGRENTPKPSGRWRLAQENGVWCGARRGYSDVHWHPLLVKVADNKPVRILDLYNHDERYWALLARGVATGREECVRLENGLVEFTFPIPEQVRRVMQFGGYHVKGWQWRIFGDTGPIWRFW
ncbi:MAG: hypothetical protein GY862_32140 [Gammaproteobacteria bacterium]|nr:hypothetical protein [Gammaproteobacteria bacterium]